MTRSSARLSTLLAATALLGGVTAVNCSKGTNSNGGIVRLALHVSPNFTVNSVHWQINSPTTTDIKHGDINTSDLNSTASVDTSVPAGSGYRVTMTASATDTATPPNTVSCTGSSPAPGFNVTAGGSVMVGVTLICGGSQMTTGSGSAIINGVLIAGDNCPVLTNWEASPLQTSSGQPINVTATATDADVGQTLTYAWTADSGSFANPALATTTYICGAPTLATDGVTRLGPAHTLTVTVHDSYTSASLPNGCPTTMTFSVDCVQAGVCGNSIIEPGETCDPPNGTNCNAQCQFVAFCGDSIITPPETCDPSNQPAGTAYGTAAAHCAACTTIPYCGDGHIDTAQGETCDPPNGGSCDASCHSVVVCASTTDPCAICEKADQGDCPNSLNQVPGASCYGCEGFVVGTKAYTDCTALLTCVRTQHCMAGDDPTPCLCGSLSASVCASSGAPTTAACATQYAAAASDAAGTVFAQFGNPTTPVGIANNQAACRVDSACASCP